MDADRKAAARTQLEALSTTPPDDLVAAIQTLARILLDVLAPSTYAQAIEQELRNKEGGVR